MVENVQSINTLENNSYENFNINSMPHSVEAEEALLGAILTDNEVYNRILYDLPLKSVHFYVPVHQRIFEATQKLINNKSYENNNLTQENFSFSQPSSHKRSKTNKYHHACKNLNNP